MRIYWLYCCQCFFKCCWDSETKESQRNMCNWLFSSRHFPFLYNVNKHSFKSHSRTWKQRQQTRLMPVSNDHRFPWVPCVPILSYVNVPKYYQRWSLWSIECTLRYSALIPVFLFITVFIYFYKKGWIAEFMILVMLNM